jgi:sugar phosphate isomerase/epimerase
MTQSSDSGRRTFLKGVGAAGLLATATPEEASANVNTRPLTEKEKLARIASNTWPIRSLFRNRSTRPNPQAEEMKKKYGTLTMMDFPQFTKDTFPGVFHMDLFSGLFGDFSDESMYSKTQMTFNGNTRDVFEFDPSSASGRKWLEKMAAKQAATGTRCHHISNNAPRDISDPDPAKRRAGVEVAKKWLDGAAILGAKSMRVNSGGPRIAPGAVVTTDYPKNDELAKYLGFCIESFKEMADHGGKVGVKVTLENHWGLTANPMNIRIVVDEVNSPFCEASPDFCNWEHEYMLYHGLADLAPYAHTTVHAKYWNRWKDNDVRRSVRIMRNARFDGIFALEYEDGPWDGVEGAKYLYKEVLAAL